MSAAMSKRRMTENEAVFREYNEQAQKGFDELIKIAKEDGQESLIEEDDLPLQFYCECSDKQCLQRIALKPSTYKRVHAHRDRFIILPGHETTTIERVIDTTKSYSIVEKTVTPVLGRSKSPS